MTLFVSAILLYVAVNAETEQNEHKIQHIVILIKENHTFDNYFGRFDHGAGADPSLAVYRGIQVNESVIPNLWHLAEEYVLCDHMYSSHPDMSFPNHFYLIAAWTPLPHAPKGVHNWSKAGYWPNRITLPNLLQAKGLSWRAYSWGKFGPYFPLAMTKARSIIKGHWFPAAQFISDVKKGILANVTWVTDTVNITDHPPHNITKADELTGEEVRAIMNSPFWNTTVIFIVEDDWGKFKDHLNILVPEYHDGILQEWKRVPCIIVSPFVKKGYISHHFHEFTSILKFVETVFGLPSINQRDFMADYFADCFNKSLIKLPNPPKFFIQDFWTGKNVTDFIANWTGMNLTRTVKMISTTTATATLTTTLPPTTVTSTFTKTTISSTTTTTTVTYTAGVTQKVTVTETVTKMLSTTTTLTTPTTYTQSVGVSSAAFDVVVGILIAIIIFLSVVAFRKRTH